MRMTRRKIINRLQKKAVYGQLNTGESVRGGWFIWLMDAVDLVEQILEDSGGLSK